MLRPSIGVAVVLCSALGIAGAGAKQPSPEVKASVIDEAEAIDSACAAGDGPSCVTLGILLSRAPAPEIDRTRRAYLQACDLGETRGCVLAARFHYLGLGGDVDLATATLLYKTGCDFGFSDACRVLGGILARGERGADRVAEGWSYLRKACVQEPQCQASVDGGVVPQAWGGSLEALKPSATPASPEPVKVGGGIAEPRKVKHVPPAYPAIAKQARIQGTVTVVCLIGTTGTVDAVAVVGSIPIFDQAAVAAVRQWRYEPTLLNGSPVPVVMTVLVEFRLK